MDAAASDYSRYLFHQTKPPTPWQQIYFLWPHFSVPDKVLVAAGYWFLTRHYFLWRVHWVEKLFFYFYFSLPTFSSWSVVFPSLAFISSPPTSFSSLLIPLHWFFFFFSWEVGLDFCESKSSKQKLLKLNYRLNFFNLIFNLLVLLIFSNQGNQDYR